MPQTLRPIGGQSSRPITTLVKRILAKGILEEIVRNAVVKTQAWFKRTSVQELVPQLGDSRNHGDKPLLLLCYLSFHGSLGLLDGLQTHIHL